MNTESEDKGRRLTGGERKNRKNDREYCLRQAN